MSHVNHDMSLQYLFCSWIIVGKVYVICIINYTVWYLGLTRQNPTQWGINEDVNTGWEQIVIGWKLGWNHRSTPPSIAKGYPQEKAVERSDTHLSWLKIPSFVCLSVPHCCTQIFHWLWRMCHCSRNLSAGRCVYQVMPGPGTTVN